MYERDGTIILVIVEALQRYVCAILSGLIPGQLRGQGGAINPGYHLRRTTGPFLPLA